MIHVCTKKIKPVTPVCTKSAAAEAFKGYPLFYCPRDVRKH
jgi:hypothetical protein